MRYLNTSKNVNSVSANELGERNEEEKRKEKKQKRPWWDSNPQSPAPEADALSIRPQGQTGLLKGSLRVHINVATALAILYLHSCECYSGRTATYL